HLAASLIDRRGSMNAPNDVAARFESRERPLAIRLDGRRDRDEDDASSIRCTAVDGLREIHWTYQQPEQLPRAAPLPQPIPMSVALPVPCAAPEPAPMSVALPVRPALPHPIPMAV